MHPITQRVFDYIMNRMGRMVSHKNIRIAYGIITGNLPTSNDIENIYDEIEQTYPPRTKSNPYSKTEIRTKPQFVLYRAYSADRKPEITQLFFTDKDKAIDHLKLLKRHGYGSLMVQKVYERYGEYAYDRPARYTGVLSNPRWPSFKSAKAYQDYLRSGGRIEDIVRVAGMLFTMDSYDFEGLLITYGNRKNNKMMSIDTPSGRNRPGGTRKADFSDAVVSFDTSDSFRPGIEYMD